MEGVETLEKHLHSKFEITDLGELIFHGIKFEMSKRGIVICCQKYTRSIGRNKNVRQSLEVLQLSKSMVLLSVESYFVISQIISKNSWTVIILDHNSLEHSLYC